MARPPFVRSLCCAVPSLLGKPLPSDSSMSSHSEEKYKDEAAKLRTSQGCEQRSAMFNAVNGRVKAPGQTQIHTHTLVASAD